MSPLDEWGAAGSVRSHVLRAWLLVVALACAAGALTGYVAGRADWSGVQRSRADLARVVAHAAAIRAASAPIPMAAAFKPIALTDLLMQLTRTIEGSGLRLRTLERMPAEKAASVTAGRRGDPATAPHFRLVVSGDFLAMRRWLAGLPHLPALVVPRALEVRRETAGGILEVDLQLFLDLPGAADAAQTVKTASVEPMVAADDNVLRERAPPDPDPFALSGTVTAAEIASGNWQLAGLLRDARHGLALFEQSGETRVLARGHVLDAASLKSVEARGVLLVLPGGRVRQIQLRARVTP